MVLLKVYLKEVNLCGAVRRWANVRGCDFRGADLDGADLNEANLRETNLSQVNLTDAFFKQCGSQTGKT